MTREEMKAYAAKINKGEKVMEIKLQENLNLIKDRSLLREEAAACMAGAQLKAAEEFGLPGAAGKGYWLLVIDQELEGDDFRGVSIDRHLSDD